jgi:Protein of unknwon function (DUF3310).
MSSANERQVAGGHYNGVAVQHWDYAVQVLGNRYLEGQITKYVMRHRKKNGMQDLQKAEHFLDKLIEEFRIGRIHGFNEVVTPDFNMADLIAQNGLNSFEAFVVKRLAFWYREDHLEQVRSHLRALMQFQRENDARIEAIKAGNFGIADVLRDEEAGPSYTNQG